MENFGFSVQNLGVNLSGFADLPFSPLYPTSYPQVVGRTFPPLTCVFEVYPQESGLPIINYLYLEILLRIREPADNRAGALATRIDQSGLKKTRDD